MIRYYILPVEQVTTTGGGIARGPKYFRWRFDPDPPGMDAMWAMMDYGLINACLLVADVTQEQHEALTANVDVASPPQNIDQQVSEIAIPAVKAVLEELRIPADWVTSAYTYRQILRMVAGLFQFAQRYHAMHGEALVDSKAALDLRWNQIPLARRNRIIATVNELGYDYSGITSTWTVRRILRHLGGQWGATVFHIGGQEL